MKQHARRWRQGLFALVIAAAMPLAITAEASAAAATRNAYAPVREDSHLRAWADLEYDCAGGMGCWNYMKIERRKGWLWWEYVGGAWVNNDGWNNVTGSLAPGCHTYRTTVISYNDVVVQDGTTTRDASSTSTTIKRLETPWSSAEVQICK